MLIVSKQWTKYIRVLWQAHMYSVIESLCSLREPALFIVLGASVLLLILAPAGTAMGFEEQESLVRDIGLSTLLLSGILVAMVTGSITTRRG